MQQASQTADCVADNSERTVTSSVSDWRLSGQEKYLAGATLFRVVFPIEGRTACREQNAILRMIADGPTAYVQENGQWQRIEEGDVSPIDWHAHCDFCWEKATPEQEGIFYFTKDMSHAVCEECFRDFHEQFKWKVLGGAAHVTQLTEEEEEK